jgi:hypothetical protein
MSDTESGPVTFTLWCCCNLSVQMMKLRRRWQPAQLSHMPWHPSQITALYYPYPFPFHSLLHISACSTYLTWPICRSHLVYHLLLHFQAVKSWNHSTIAYEEQEMFFICYTESLHWIQKKNEMISGYLLTHTKIDLWAARIMLYRGMQSWKIIHQYLFLWWSS